MRIGIYHGYELIGSGSNEYTRYLARALHDAGHEVHLICREPRPEKLSWISPVFEWSEEGEPLRICERLEPGVTLHRIPHGAVRPVYLTDKQRPGRVVAFPDLTDEELAEYHALNERVLVRILMELELDVLHANHLVYQPVAAIKACTVTGTPLVIFPHGSSIEYTVRRDSRYLDRARDALQVSAGVICGNEEVRGRLVKLFPDMESEIIAKTRIVGVGVDTGVFTPIARRDRVHAIGALTTPGGAGKSAAQREDLASRLAAEGVEATRGYWEAYDHETCDQDAVERIQSLDLDRDVVTFVGALTHGKGVQGLICAFPEVVRQRPGAQLVIVGSGAYREVLEALVHAIDRGDADLLRELAARGRDLDRNDATGPWEDVEWHIADETRLAALLASGRGLAERVLFTGRLPHEVLSKVLPCSDLTVFPSIVPEAYPLVLMESLAAGVLPLVSYFSGFRDGVDEIARLVPSPLTGAMALPIEPEGRVSEIATRIVRVLADPTREALGPVLRRAAESYFDWRLRAHQMANAYAEICAARERVH